MRLPAIWASSLDPGLREDWALPLQPLPRTALRIKNGFGEHWEAHLARLREGIAHLDWDCNRLDESMAQVKAWASDADQAVCLLRVRPSGIQARLDPLPDPVPLYRLQPMQHPLGDLRHQERSRLKGLLGSWDRVARDSAQSSGASDALLLWPDGTIAETAISCCGLLREGTFHMPPKEGRVKSISEELDLPGWARQKGWRVSEAPIPFEEISLGQIWCMNAVRGLWQAETITS